MPKPLNANGISNTLKEVADSGYELLGHCATCGAEILIMSCAKSHAYPLSQRVKRSCECKLKTGA